jgi:putative transcriptional regulator
MSDFPDAQTRYEQALEEVVEHLRTGTPFPNTEVYDRRVVDIPALRRRYRLTQQAFADRLGISIGTLRNWEQKRRIPDGPAQRLLELIEDRREVAEDIFHRDAEPAPEGPPVAARRRVAGERR